jgi:hypothetical protein
MKIETEIIDGNTGKTIAGLESGNSIVLNSESVEFIGGSEGITLYGNSISAINGLLEIEKIFK